MSSYPKYMIMLAVGLAMVMQLSSASGLGWVLNGTIVDAGTCTPIAGANVTSPYNGNAYNISNSNGGYRLVLGTGNWTVTIKAAGYGTSFFNTPYETAGGVTYNFLMLKAGESAMANCAYFQGQETTISTTSSVTTTTSTTNYNTSSTPSKNVTNSSASQSIQSGMSAAQAIGIVIVVIIAIAIAYYLVSASKKGRSQHVQK
jgi:hypothetical protein